MFSRAALFLSALCLAAAPFAAAGPTDLDSWRQWRGPHNNGVAEGDAPTKFSADENVKWRVSIPGKGHSTPVVWGDVIYLTTAAARESPQPAARRGRPGPGGPGGGFDPAAMIERLPPDLRREAQDLLQGRSPADLEEDERARFRAIMQRAFQGGGPDGRGRGPRGGAPRGGSGGSGELVETDFLVIALDRNTGKVIWRKTAVTTTPHEGYHRQYGSFASNSPVTDGETLIANFGSRGIYAYDMDGNLQWSKDLGKLQMRLQFGEGIAPVLHGNYLIVQNDHEGQSYIVVLDKNDGSEIWRAERDERSSWPQPIVVDYDGRKQLVTSSTRIRSYDLATGEIVWEAGGLGGNAIPAVVNVDNEMVIAMTGWRDANLLAVKLGGKGDLTDNPEFISWSNQRGNSYSASPVLHGGILYFVSDRGMVSAFDARTGEKFYNQQRLPQSYTFKASPVAANGKLYLASEEGDVIVLKLGKTYEVLAVNAMGEETFISSPFIVGGDLFLRSEDELFCIGAD